MAPLTESVTHPAIVLKVTDIMQAFYRCESSLEEFQRGGPTERDDDVKANDRRHDAQGNPGCCGLAAAVPCFHRDLGLNVAARVAAS